MTCGIGMDVGGTKIAAGIVLTATGQARGKRLLPTCPERGGAAVLEDLESLAKSLLAEAKRDGLQPAALGVGVAELVDTQGNVLSDATIAWTGLPARERLAKLLPARVEADVRAAALAEARFGAGAGHANFLYVTIGTGISSCLVMNGVPFAGARGMTGTFASSPGLIPGMDGLLHAGPPLEHYAGGPSLALRLRATRPDFSGSTKDVLGLAESGDAGAKSIVESAGKAVGAAVAQLVNVLDPEAVVLGGGLGLVGGLYRSSLETAFRSHVWSPLHRVLPLLPARLGADAGFIGAALAAVEHQISFNQPC
jgi:glucokinase